MTATRAKFISIISFPNQAKFLECLFLLLCVFSPERLAVVLCVFSVIGLDFIEPVIQFNFEESLLPHLYIIKALIYILAVIFKYCLRVACPNDFVL